MEYLYYGDAMDAGEEYLEHYGIHGQKWGIRRFQNSDGSLTAAGRKRYGSGLRKAAIKVGNKVRTSFRDYVAREKAKKQNSRNVKKAIDERNKQAKKSWDQMTDDERRKAYNESIMMENYLRSQKNIRDLNASLNPKQVRAGSRMVSSFMKNVAQPVFENSTKNFIQKGIDRSIDSFYKKRTPKTADEIRKEEADRAKTEFDIWNYKNQADKSRREYDSRQSGIKTDDDLRRDAETRAKQAYNYWNYVNKADQNRREYNSRQTASTENRTKKSYDTWYDSPYEYDPRKVLPIIR